MKITIEATPRELEEMKDDLYKETGQTFTTKEQVAIGLSCLIDERVELPGYNIHIKEVSKTTC